MSGNHRMDVGEITQSAIKGSAMEKALATSMDSPIPHTKEAKPKSKQKKGKK